jgi:hypothetical protein
MKTYGEWRDYWERLNQCIDNVGRHVSDIIIENALCVLFMIKNIFCILLGLVFISFPNQGVLSAALCRKITDLILVDREIADKVGISLGSAHSILTDDLHMCRAAAKFVLKLLSQEQQQLALRSHGTCWSVPTGILSS